VIIGDRLRQLREAKKQSQGDIEIKTGLLRCYVSRVENGHTVPAIETLEKFARALEVPMYQIFHDGTDIPKSAKVRVSQAEHLGWANSGKSEAYFHKLKIYLSRMSPEDRGMLLKMTMLTAQRSAKSEKDGSSESLVNPK
jgi:transcriptional regulator with XRE-family HTH domain